MSTALWIAGAIFVILVHVFGLALCKAAARGDRQMEDELAQFHHGWERRP